MNSCSFNVEGSEGSCRTIAKHLFCLGQKLFFVRYFRERSRPMRRPAIEDRRIQKTLSLLREALVSLIAEKPYDSIVVKEILDRANVGRSAFYTHFRDKDELLVSGIRHMLGPVRAPAASAPLRPHEQMLWFSLPVFEYVDPHRHTSRKMGTKGRALVHEHLRKVIAQLIADGSTHNVGRRRKDASQVPADLLAQY